MISRRALLALLMVPFFAVLVLMSPPVPAPIIIDPGDGGGGGVACADTDSTCWHTATGTSGVVRDMIIRRGTYQVVAASSTGLTYSADGRLFRPFPVLPPGTLNSLATRPVYELFVGTSSGLYRQQVPLDINPSFIAMLTNVSVSYVASPTQGSVSGPVYANITSPTNQRGLWRSPDGQTGWQRVLPNVEVQSLVVPFGCDSATDPQASNRVYVSTRCPTCTSPNLGALWVSINAGLAGTWTALPGPSRNIKDLAIVCGGPLFVSQRWMFAANGETTGAVVWRSLPTATALGLNFEPWSNGIPPGGGNSFRGDQGLVGDWGVLAATGSGLYRLPYNLNNAWVPYTVRGLQSPIINRWVSSYTALDVATSSGVSFYWGSAPN